MLASLPLHLALSAAVEGPAHQVKSYLIWLLPTRHYATGRLPYLQLTCRQIAMSGSFACTLGGASNKVLPEALHCL